MVPGLGSGARAVAVMVGLVGMLALAAPPCRAEGATRAATPVPVLVVGGSAAVGWVDDTGLGYVERGFLAYGARAGFSFAFTNHAIPGARVTSPLVTERFGDWVSALGPGGVVVIAWGLLNDVRLKTPTDVFRRALRRQIRTALAHSDLVVIVTPPATRASFERERTRERELLTVEHQVARRFHSPRLYVADVFDPETAYFRRRHLPYRRYMAGLWDPNTAGHALAGRVLARALTGALPASRLSRQVSRLGVDGARAGQG